MKLFHLRRDVNGVWRGVRGEHHAGLPEGLVADGLFHLLLRSWIKGTVGGGLRFSTAGFRDWLRWLGQGWPLRYSLA